MLQWLWVALVGLFITPGMTLVFTGLAYHLFGRSNPTWFGYPTSRNFFVAVKETTIGSNYGLRADLTRILGVIPVSLMLTGPLTFFARFAGTRLGILSPLFVWLTPLSILLISIGVLRASTTSNHVVYASAFIGLLSGLIFSGWCHGVAGKGFIVVTGLAGGFLGGLTGLLAMGGLYSGLLIDRFLSPVLAIPLKLARFRTIICANCLQYVTPLGSTYHGGVRSCEHCRETVELTHIPGSVIFVFGTLDVPPAPRQFVRQNPAFGATKTTDFPLSIQSPWSFTHREQPVDVSQVYIDTATCDRFLLERFLTFIINFPPKGSLESVEIIYHGSLDELGSSLRNTLYNTFNHITLLSGSKA